ncbi:MAG: DUF1501 domain-containing protein [Ilumatobacter sp.]|uniref:DUF1501 domain-containing protein n=1 Tax=Ilumatobacter sp. TaxID=1967498 RepID=UPI00391A0B09
MSETNLGTGTHSRREFLRRAGLLAGAGFAAPWAMDLAGLASAAPSAATDYRAIVCLFMYGGNDHYNTFIPDDDEGYRVYAAARAGIARPRSSILPISPARGFDGAGTFGFAPELPQLRDIFDGGDAAVVANLGTLVRPIDKAGYAVASNRPPQLFSHNDQQSYWQSSSPEGATTGWGGRIADLILDGASTSSTFTCISVAGNAVMMTGRDAIQYQVSTNGVTRLRDNTFRHDAALAGIRDVMELQQPGLFPSSYSTVSKRALDAADGLGDAIAAAEDRYDVDSAFDTATDNIDLNRINAQLRMVAKLIAAGRDTLGIKRQVFFVAMGGFDNHNGLTTRHPLLLAGLDGGVASFYRATQLLGAADSVTTFTASDFGRTLVSNGDGSDHGWGGHHLVVGGSVRGRRVFGSVPTIADDGPDDVGRGRLLPTTSVDQYAATLASWMGAGTSELRAVVPNITNYAVTDLGFLGEPGARVTDGIGNGGNGGLRRATRIAGS